MTELDAVLARIHADLDASLDRLFKFLSIKSISTDPAYAEDCRAAAASRDGSFDPRHRRRGPPHRRPSRGVRQRVRPPVRHARPSPPRGVLWSLRRAAGRSSRPRQTPPFEPRIATLADGRKAIVARGACDDKGQVMTFIEACRAWKAVTGSLPLDVTFLIEGEEECGSKHLPPWVEAHRAELAGDVASSATPACGTRRRRPSPRRCAASSMRRSRSRRPTATCIPACSVAPPRIRSRARQDHRRHP